MENETEANLCQINKSDYFVANKRMTLESNDFSQYVLPYGASWGQSYWQTAIQNVDLMMVHVAYPLRIDFVDHARIFVRHLADAGSDWSDYAANGNDATDYHAAVQQLQQLMIQLVNGGAKMELGV